MKLKHEERVKKIVSPIEADLGDMIEDLEACHEYYCKYNCGRLTGNGEHTPRCRYLQETYGFPPQERPPVPPLTPKPATSPYTFNQAMTEKKCSLCNFEPMEDNRHGPWANELMVHFINEHFGDLPHAVVSKIHDREKRKEMAK